MAVHLLKSMQMQRNNWSKQLGKSIEKGTKMW